MIKQIINWFKSKRISLVRLDEQEIKRSLPKINYKILNPAKHYLLDKDYHSCSITEFKNLLKKDFTNWKIANKDYDCDNFAFKLYSNIKNKYPTLSIGIAISTNHAFNLFIDKSGKLWYIEPQTDKVFSNSKLTKYKPILIIIWKIIAFG